MGTTADKLAALAASQADIKSALTTMGRTPSDLLRTYGDEIRAIKTGDKITNAKEFYVVAKDKIKIGDTVYTVDGVKDMYADAGTTALNNSARIATFSPDGKTLVLSGVFTGRANT